MFFKLNKWILVMWLLAAMLSIQACSTAKPPPQCDGAMRPLNGTKLSALEVERGCRKDKELA